MLEPLKSKLYANFLEREPFTVIQHFLVWKLLDTFRCMTQ